jgi:hypothetical protein
MCSQGNREAGIDRATAFAATAKHLSLKRCHFADNNIDRMLQP